MRRILILLTLFMCSQALAQRLDTVTLYLKWDHQFEFAGYYAAKEKGFFKDNGLYVNFGIFRNGIDQIKKVEEAEGRYGISNSNLLSYRIDGHQIVLLLPVFQHSSVVFFTHKRDSIFHPQDLIGKKIVIPKVMFPELYLMMVREGIDPTSTDIDSVWNLQKFVNGDAQAIVQLTLDRPFMPEPDSISIIHPLQYGMDFYGELLYTSEAEIKRNPERATRFREAVIKGWDYAMSNPEEIIDIILDKYDSTLDKDVLLREYAEIRELMSPGIVPVGLNNIGRWENLYNDISKYSGIEATNALDGFFYEDYFASDTERLGNIIALIAILLGFLFFFLIVAWIINRRLNKLLDERLVQINLRNEELTKMNNELDNFVYRVSHDLRSPISSSMGLLNLMEKDTKEKRYEYHQLMKSSLVRLDNFIKDILHYSRNSRMEIELEKIDFESLINQCIETVADQETDISVSQELVDCTDYFGDRNRISIILNNLISNSFRYSDRYKEEKYIKISAICSENQARIIVEDNGIGISKDHREQVFKMFYRAHDQKVGSGLGLYIVSEVVEKLKGTIELDSELGVGTKIMVTLPVRTQ